MSTGMPYFLPLHTVLEMVAVLVAIMIFGVGWHSYDKQRPSNIAVLAIVLLGVGLLDIAHTLSFDGMPPFVTENSANKSIYFWLSARTLFALSMLYAALAPWRPLRYRATRPALLGTVLAIVALVCWLVFFHEGALPPTFVVGQGLTPFKIGFEYAIALIHAVAILALIRLAKRPQSFDLLGLLLCNIATLGSELLVTRYALVTDSYSLIAHLFKAVAYLFLYRTVFIDSVRAPFLRLQQSEQALLAQQERLEILADHDPLTGLYNRRRFTEALRDELQRAKQNETRCSLFFIDVDGLKYVNDSLGHHAGDQLLLGFTESLTQQLRGSDLIARLGGDEFAVVLPDTNLEEARVAARALLAKVNTHPVKVQGQPVRMSCSIGVATFPEHGQTGEELLRRADLAMYQAKQKGRNRISVFAAVDQQQSVARQTLAWAPRLRDALKHDSFEVCLQPILDLKTGEVAQQELLLRLRDENGKVVPPSLFLEAAERSGLLRAIDQWVVRRAALLLKELPHIITVNLSATALRDIDIVSVVARECTDAGVNPDRLVLEITETSAVTNPAQAEAVIRLLQRLGCSLAIDDFGMGFSGFYQLKRLPVNYLKIDGSFIRNLAKEPADQHIVKGMIDLAHHLEKKTIVEYVEDQETLDIVTRLGADYAQGYHIGKPIPQSSGG